MMLDVPTLPDRAMLCVRNRLHELLSTDVSNALRYKQEVGVVAYIFHLTLLNNLDSYALCFNVRLQESAHCATASPLLFYGVTPCDDVAGEVSDHNMM